MSDDLGNELAERLQSTISEYVSELEGGGMMTGFVASVDYLDGDGDRCWLHAQAKDQSITTTIGILEWYMIFVKDYCVRAIRGEHD